VFVPAADGYSGLTKQDYPKPWHTEPITVTVDRLDDCLPPDYRCDFFEDDVPRPPAVLFVGYLARRDNSERIAWFLRRCWPSVLEQHPGARLIVSGANPPAWLRSDANNAAMVTGYLDNLDRATGGLSSSS
jgi:hypothetical protein